jgi:hypothetical protein
MVFPERQQAKCDEARRHDEADNIPNSQAAGL